MPCRLLLCARMERGRLPPASATFPEQNLRPDLFRHACRRKHHSWLPKHSHTHAEQNGKNQSGFLTIIQYANSQVRTREQITVGELWGNMKYLILLEKQVPPKERQTHWKQNSTSPVFQYSCQISQTAAWLNHFDFNSEIALISPGYQKRSFNCV